MTGKIIIGSILVLLGLSLFLDQLGIFEFDYIAGKLLANYPYNTWSDANLSKARV
jgi:hypothetical protein